MGHSKISSKSEVYCNTILPQETRKISNNLVLSNATRERRMTKNPKLVERKKDLAEINGTDMEKTEKINEAGSLKRS